MFTERGVRPSWSAPRLGEKLKDSFNPFISWVMNSGFKKVGVPPPRANCLTLLPRFNDMKDALNFLPERGQIF